jgi:DNA-binding transcriptional LysR family regulator
MRAVNPHLELRLMEADPPAAIPLLTSGHCDLALVYAYPILRRPDEAGVDLEVLFADQMALALPVGHPLAGAARVSLLALAAEPWIAPHDSVCREALVFACRTAGFEPRVVSETNDYAAMQGLIAGGVGVALLPRLACAFTLKPGVVVRPLGEQLIERVTFIATRTGAYRAPTVGTIRQLLRDALQHATISELPLEPFDFEHPTASLPRPARRGQRGAVASIPKSISEPSRIDRT